MPMHSKCFEASPEVAARVAEAIYQSLSQADAPALDNVTALVEWIARRDEMIGHAIVAETRYCDARKDERLLTRSEVVRRALDRLRRGDYGETLP